MRVLGRKPDYPARKAVWAASSTTDGKTGLLINSFSQLERLVDPDLRQHIVWERAYRPDDFEADFNAVHGTAFGSLSHGFFQSSYFRPHNKARDIKGLYFVGQGTYPGIGMPMVHLSAKLVTERIVREWPQEK
ncbi:MAG: hypothetical protein EHM81_01575 [Chloroflexi bacterium]|nr:MAG: hypothetical protein EHM81_01575 [Chloroflexota bacterium]